MRTSLLKYMTFLIGRSLLASAVAFQLHAVAADSSRPILLPEASDPVLGDRAAIAEWAWSPAYAKRFGLPVQKDGLRDGYLWLVGVKVLRVQDQDAQTYQCRIVGLIDNKAPMLTPPGDRYLRHPARTWMGGLPYLPQKRYFGPTFTEQHAFSPAQGAWRKRPKSQAERERPHSGIGAEYLFFHRNYTPELAYFELHSSCWHFRDPEPLRNELRFPTETDARDHTGNAVHPTFAPSALKFDIPDRVMKQIYPYTLKAADWNRCLMRRGGDTTTGLNKEEAKRLPVSCKPVASTSINR